MLVQLGDCEKTTEDVLQSIRLSPSLKKYALIDVELKGIDLEKIRTENV